MGGVTVDRRAPAFRHVRPAAVLAALALIVAAGVTALIGAQDPPASARARAQSAARSFLDRYLDGDGRVVRRDQGGDTVSEGQAYAMLAAVVAGDRARFQRTWDWTRRHLQRTDGLLSWHWQGGRVVDPQSSADADLDSAHALLLAARRFRAPADALQARRMARAIRGAEVRSGVLVAGPWAMATGVVNPSYVDPRALVALRMTDVAGASRAVLAALVAGGRTPPDWAAAGPPPGATGAPGTSAPPSYGFDAARVPIRLAASCDRSDRRLAAGLRGLGQAAAARDPVFTVARAAQAKAAGDGARAAALLDRAAAQDRAAPTYYGAAWVALGRALLQTDLLGGCPRAR